MKKFLLIGLLGLNIIVFLFSGLLILAALASEPLGEPYGKLLVGFLLSLIPAFLLFTCWKIFKVIRNIN